MNMTYFTIYNEQEKWIELEKHKTLFYFRKFLSFFYSTFILFHTFFSLSLYSLVSVEFSIREMRARRKSWKKLVTFTMNYFIILQFESSLQK